MLHKFTPFIMGMLMLLSSLCTYGQEYQGAAAARLIPGSEWIRVNPLNNSLQFVKLAPETSIRVGEHENWLETALGFRSEDQLEFYREEADKLGYVHYRYYQFYKGYQVENGVYYVHTKNNKVVSANGELYPEINVHPVASLSESAAFNYALANIQAKQYAWQLSPDKTPPKGDLVIFPVNPEEKTYKLAYKFDIYAVTPLSREYVFVDANTGDILATYDRIHATDVPGTAVTKYRGTKPITTDSLAPNSFRLREAGRSIETYDLNTSVNKAAAVDFTDTDNLWNTTTNQDDAAYDAHWSAEWTYDYFLNEQGRDSYDGQGSTIKNYIHYGNFTVNAFWDGDGALFGDGDGGTITALTSPDVVGHELTHGVTQFSAGLIYQNEPGALNESYSDIFGTVISFYSDPLQASWTLGVDFNFPLRDMSNPNVFSDPDTYLGNFWITGPFDNGGVHTNSGVQNYWFYLMSEGGSGTNDNGDSYSITGLGLLPAADITYRSLAFYMTPTSPYADARFYSIIAAQDIYGGCSPEVITTTNAWHAVGVGGPFSTGVSAGFVAKDPYTCTVPGDIQFTNLSINGTSYLWDFGDGTTSTDTHPLHTYTSADSFTVKLVTTGSGMCNSADSITQVEYVIVANGGSPIAASCTPITVNPTGSFNAGIYNVSLGLINHTTNGAVEGYQDYTCGQFTPLVEGNNYPISVTTGPFFSENVRIWIDFNNDGNFSNATEEVFSGSGSGILTGTLSIPGGSVKNVPLRMRVGADTGILSNACSNSQESQYEDYTVKILDNTFPPDVDFIANPQAVSPGGSINFSDLSLNVPTGWEWDFPGGAPSSSTLQNPSVIYTTLGTYPVSLKASNSFGADSLTKTAYITVANTNNMCINDSAVSTSGIIYDSGGPSAPYSDGEFCTFLIDPGCADSITLTFSSFELESGFDFLSVYDGEDASAPQLGLFTGNTLPGPLYAPSGKMFLQFTSDGSTTFPGFVASWTSVIPSGTPPIAGFSATPDPAPLNVDVQFTDQTTLSPVAWFWDFGDGNFSIQQNPLHPYASPGTYNVTLIADNCFGLDTVTNSVTILPSPTISVNPDSINESVPNCGDSVDVTITIYNTGAGPLVFETGTSSNGITDSLQMLATTFGVDFTGEYATTLNLISQVYPSYVLTESNTTDPAVLQSELVGKQVFLVAEQELSVPAAFTGFAPVLQNFVNDGGTVIFCGTSTFNSDHLFNSGLFSGNYFNTTFFSGTNYNILQPTHPLMDLITGMTSQNATTHLNITDPDAVRVVEFNDVGNTFDVVTYREVGLGRVVYIGFDYFLSDFASGQVIGNAVSWAAANAAVSWVTVTPDSGMVAINDSLTITVTLSSDGLATGTYMTDLFINSNDSANPILTIPVTFTVGGEASIALSDTCLDFGSIIQFTSVTDTMQISNDGCDTLVINISTTNPDFTSGTNTLIVLPGDTSDLAVTFSPSGVGPSTGLLNLLNNATDTTVCLNGIGLGAPAIEVNPDSINETIFSCNDSITVPVTIYNTGLSDLNIAVESGVSITGDSIKILGYTFGVDYLGEYTNVIGLINQAYPKNILTETGTIDSTTLAAELDGQDVFLVAEQELGFPNVFSDISSVLQDFVNNGGTVIFCGTDNASSSHIFNTGLFSGVFGFTNFNNGDSYNILVPTHPLVDLITSMSSQNATTYINITDPDAVRVVEFDDGFATYDVVTYREIGAGRVVYIGFDYFAWDVNAGQAVGNAVSWAASQALPSWLNVTPDTASIPVGDSTTIFVTLSSQGLVSGTYTSNITIQTNDPLNPTVTIPVTFNVMGTANIALSDTCLEYVNTQQFFTATQTVDISNDGCDSLFVSIISTNPLFAPDTNMIGIPPGGTYTLPVYFSSDSVGVFSGTLNLLNNATDTTICLNANVIGAPQAVASPNPLAVTVPICNDSATVPLTIYNTGLGNMTYDLTTGGAGFDSTSFQNFFTDGATTMHNFSGLSTVGDTVRMEITINGDFDGTSEFADLYVDGSFVATIQDNNLANGTDIVESFEFTGAQVSGWLADGQILVDVVNSAGVNDGLGGLDFHQVKLEIPGGGDVLSLTPDTGAVLVGDSVIIDVTIDVTGLTPGVYTYFILINSNSPVNNPLAVPVIVTVTDGPILAIADPNCVDFGNVAVGGMSTQTVTLQNTGCDILAVIFISPSKAEYTVSPTNLVIMPQDSATVTVTFSPGASGNFDAQLDISTNSNNEVVCLKGDGSAPPIIGTGQTSLEAVVPPCEEAYAQTFTIINGGGGDLNYTLAPSSQAWVTYSPNSGTVAPSGSATITVLFDGTGVNGGTYFTDVVIDSDDPATPQITLPVTITISNQPCAEFGSNLAGPCSGIVTFKDSTTNLPTFWNWSFGDGGTSNQQNPSHTFTMPGTYLVTLIAGNNDGTDTANYSVTVTGALNPDIDVQGLFNANETLTFSTSVTNVNTYIWDFGNGDSSSVQAPGYIYTAAGSYVVTLTVIDDSGCEVTVTKTIFVDFPVGIDPNENNALNIYPNPSEGKFWIDYTGSGQDIEIEITNGLGQLVLREKVKGVVDLHHQIVLPKGTSNAIYMVKLIDGDKQYTGRVYYKD